MTASRAVPSPWTVALLLVGAMVIPRLEADRVEMQDASSVDSVWHTASVDYARKRLWNDFLDSRALAFPGRALPGPTLEEYREYLKAVGLFSPKSSVTILVFPPLHRDHETDRIKVGFAESQPTRLVLSVSIWETEQRARMVGQLAIERDDEGMLSCRSEQVGRSLWSYWPITPQPILP